MTPRIIRVALAAAILNTVAGLAANAADLGGPMNEPRFLAPPVARAPSFYVAVRGGIDATGRTTFETGNARTTTTYDSGPMISVAVGAHLDALLGEAQGLRLELDAGRHLRDARSHVSAGLPVASSIGGLTTHYVVASLYYDLLPEARFTPFVGAGAGLAEVTFDIPGGTTTHRTSTSSVDWAYHATAGLSYKLTPRWQVESAYRYFAVPSVTPRDAAGARQHTETNEHLVFAGLRAHF